MTKYAIYAFLIEDTQEAFDDLMKGAEGADSWTSVQRDAEHDQGAQLLDAISDYNLDVEALLGG